MLKEVSMSKTRITLSVILSGLAIGLTVAVAASTFPLSHTPQEQEADPAPIFVEGDVQKPVKTYAPAPHYTQEAKEAGIQGAVLLQAVIGKQGGVEQVEVLQELSHGLTEAAADTIRTWKFEPATLDGEPVSVYFNLTINFRLE